MAVNVGYGLIFLHLGKKDTVSEAIYNIMVSWHLSESGTNETGA